MELALAARYRHYLQDIGWREAPVSSVPLCLLGVPTGLNSLSTVGAQLYTCTHTHTHTPLTFEIEMSGINRTFWMMGKGQ